MDFIDFALASLVLARSGQRDGHVRRAQIGWIVPASLIGIVVGIELLASGVSLLWRTAASA